MAVATVFRPPISMEDVTFGSRLWVPWQVELWAGLQCAFARRVMIIAEVISVLNIAYVVSQSNTRHKTLYVFRTLWLYR